MWKFLKESSYLFICIVLVFLLIVAIFWALSIGTVKLPIEQIYMAVIMQLQSDTPIDAIGKGPVHDIIWLLRLPRLVLAAIVGCGLSVCGVIMQAIVKNPLADPYILGISSGASLGQQLQFYLVSVYLLAKILLELPLLLVLLQFLWEYCLFLILGDVPIP